MTFWIVGGLVVVAFGAAIVGGIVSAQRENERDAAMADRLTKRRDTERFIERLRNGGGC